MTQPIEWLNGMLEFNWRFHRMLSPETLERYRRMTPGERLALSIQITQESEPYLLYGTPEQVDRKFELLRRQNDERNRNMLEAIARTRRDP